MSKPVPIGPFGQMLTPAERKEFVDLARPTRYGRGDVLFREDDVTRHGILIDSGSVKIVRRRRDGADLILAIRGANDLIGEMAAIDSRTLRVRRRERDQRSPVTVALSEAIYRDACNGLHDDQALENEIKEKWHDSLERHLFKVKDFERHAWVASVGAPLP